MNDELINLWEGDFPETEMDLIIYIIVFIYGIVFGSFLNVVIFRVPKHESIVRGQSHCMTCGHKLSWYELIPVFSYIFQRGRCRSCGEKISPQYPLIETMNGVLWCLSFRRFGMTPEFFMGAALLSVLVCISIVDARTMEIPLSFNIAIFAIGIARLIFSWPHILEYLIGAVAVSGFLLIVYILTGGGGVGGGDIKLMAAAGLLLGWKCIIIAFLIGCILGSVIHIIRMAVFHAGRKLALGPYLSAGIAIAFFFGNDMINTYLGLLGL
jgi:leader peptidase (prepilin peptidase)/N-methyltransferase